MQFELSEDQLAIQKMVREFAEKEVAPEIDLIERDGGWKSSVLKNAAALGLAGMPIHTEYGGTGLAPVS